jgi:hypothetical protein
MRFCYFLSRRKRCGAFFAELGVRRIFSMTLWALNRHFYPLFEKIEIKITRIKTDVKLIGYTVFPNTHLSPLFIFIISSFLFFLNTLSLQEPWLFLLLFSSVDFSFSLKNARLREKKKRVFYIVIVIRQLVSFRFTVRETPMGKIVSHSGGFSGINSNLDVFVNSGYIVAVMSNIDMGASPLARKIRELILNIK